MEENVSGYYISQKYLAALQGAQGFQGTVAQLNLYAVSGLDFQAAWLSQFNNMNDIVVAVVATTPAFKECILTLSTSSGRVAYMQGKTFAQVQNEPNANTSPSVCAALQYIEGNVSITQYSSYSKEEKKKLYDLMADGYEIQDIPFAIKNADGRFGGFATSQSLSKAYRRYAFVGLQLRAQIGNLLPLLYVATSTRIKNLSSNYL